MNEKTIYFNYFLNQLKFRLDIERQLVKPTHFNKKWATILGAL